jgi:hypothetical protein
VLHLAVDLAQAAADAVFFIYMYTLHLGLLGVKLKIKLKVMQSVLATFNLELLTLMLLLPL